MLWRTAWNDPAGRELPLCLIRLSYTFIICGDLSSTYVRFVSTLSNTVYVICNLDFRSWTLRAPHSYTESVPMRQLANIEPNYYKSSSRATVPAGRTLIQLTKSGKKFVSKTSHAAAPVPCRVLVYMMSFASLGFAVSSSIREQRTRVTIFFAFVNTYTPRKKKKKKKKSFWLRIFV